MTLAVWTCWRDELRRVTGHASPVMTERYLSPLEEHAEPVRQWQSTLLGELGA